MASESRLYTFSSESITHLRKFRLATSRCKTPQAVIYMIDRATLEIKQQDQGTVYTDLESIGEDLPDHSPRFILLSYPLTLSSGRTSVPMLYAGSKELMRNTAEVGKVFEIESANDLENLPQSKLMKARSIMINLYVGHTFIFV